MNYDPGQLIELDDDTGLWFCAMRLAENMSEAATLDPALETATIQRRNRKKNK